MPWRAPVSSICPATDSFRADDPLESGLLLADGELDVAGNHGARLHGVGFRRLAVLSACQTAIADFRNLPDEAIGFRPV
jgi:CHAT domain-containing protein